MATQLGRNVRRHVHRISAFLKLPSHGRPAFSARFYCDSSISQTRALDQLSAAAPSSHSAPTPDSDAYSAGQLAVGLVVATLCGWHIFGIYVPLIRTMLWNPEKAEKKMLEKLKRKKNESPEAYLDMLDRELNTLEAKLYKRGGDGKKVRIYEREIAAVKSMFYARDEEGEKITERAKYALAG